MSSTMVEVELRCPLRSDDELRELQAFLEREGTFRSRQRRLFVDYSTFLEGIEARKLDVRVRVTNGQVEIIVKAGTFGGASRNEASVTVQDQNFVGATSVMALLGYRRGVAGLRNIVRYNLRGGEIAIQEVLNYSSPTTVDARFIEIEMLSSEEERTATEASVRNLVQELGYRPFSEDEFHDYVRHLNETSNGVFDFYVDDPTRIVRLADADQ